MDRELLIEIGCEEIPAGWLPNLTVQMAQHVDTRLKDARLTTNAGAETLQRQEADRSRRFYSGQRVKALKEAIEKLPTLTWPAVACLRQ